MVRIEQFDLNYGLVTAIILFIDQPLKKECSKWPIR